MGAPVAPVSIKPSGNFLGNDGNWYTFQLSVGTPAQTMEVLPSTLIAEALVVNEKGCEDSPFSTCTTIRGGVFDNTSSTSWEKLVDGKYFSLSIEENLGTDPNDGGYWGYDTIGLPKTDGTSLSIDRQVVSNYFTTDFFVGMVGLSRKASAITGNSQPSFLTDAYNKKDIPSLSYSYTAGAYYPPSLTLGGQDLSRLQMNNLNFTMAPSGDRDLVAGVQAITLDAGSGPTQMLSDGIEMFIDTTQPYIWLPPDACASFAFAFGLTQDEITNRYTLTSDQHAQNLKQNATVTFTLGNMVAGGSTVNIVFPYSAFDLNYTQPDITVPKTSFMFPIREQDNAQSYTLGRAFLQEAYLSVNYEFSNFSIYPAVPSTGSAPAQIVALPSMDGLATSQGSPGAPMATSSSSGLPTGAVAGIIVAVLLLLIGAILAFFCVRRRRRHRAAAARGGVVRTYSQAPEGPLPPELEQRDTMREVKPKPEYFGYIQNRGKFHQKPYDVPVVSSDSDRGELDSNGPTSPAMSSPADVGLAYHETAQELAAAPIPRYELPTRTTSHRDSSRQSQALSPGLEPGPSSPSPLLSRDGDWGENGTHLEEASLHSNGRPSMMSADSVIILQPGSPTMVSHPGHNRSNSRIVSSNLDEPLPRGSEALENPSSDHDAILAAATMAYGTNPEEPLSPTNPMLPALAARENRSQDTLVGSHEAVRREEPESPLEDFVHNSPEHASLGYGSRWQRPH